MSLGLGQAKTRKRATFDLNARRWKKGGKKKR